MESPVKTSLVHGDHIVYDFRWERVSLVFDGGGVTSQSQWVFINHQVDDYISHILYFLVTHCL